MSRFLRAVASAGMLLALAACGERTQSASSQPAKKADSKAWDAAQNPYVAPGWKPGDQASWEAQMRARAQGQNEYLRTAAKPQ